MVCEPAAVCRQCDLHLYDASVKHLLEDAITDLCRTHGELMMRLRIRHIDRALFKYRTASEKQTIWNTMGYFKACLLSAVKESGIYET